MRLDELRLKSAESALAEAAALERHAPAAARDAEATRELAQAAGDLAAVQLGGFVAGGSTPPVASPGGSASGTGTTGGQTIGTGGGAGAGRGFATGPRFLASRPGEGRQGGRILAEEWIGENCSRTSFQVPNPQNSQALAEGDFVDVPGWDCSGALGVPVGTVVYYDPEAWEALQGVARLGKTSSGGSVNPSLGAGQRRDAGRGLVNRNAGRSSGSAGGTGTFGASTSPPSVSTDAKVLKLLGDIATASGATAAELKKRPAGPSGSKGQRLV